MILMSGKFHVHNFGCRASQADGAAIERSLIERGMQRAENIRHAEIAVLNTCTVTAAADADVRAAIRRIRRENPDCKILVTGCYAQRTPAEIAALDGVDWVVGNSHKNKIAEILAPEQNGFVPARLLNHTITQSRNHPIVFVGDIFAHTELLAAPVFDARISSEKTRPNLKVQDGCDNRCSFCVIPSVRGGSRSLSLNNALREVDGLVQAGYREIVLSGINLGRWGKDFAPQDHFENLLHQILERTGIEKIRISSVEPMDWSNEVIEMVTSHPRIARHAHVPLQSGSDRILRAMHRKYRPWHYSERAHKIRSLSSVAAIGADVMVGFPGETDELFEESRRFIELQPFTYLHVFTFSARPGTAAAALSDQIPVHVARERNHILREIAAEKNRKFRESFLGMKLNAITLAVGDEHATEALSDNFLRLHIAGKHEPNQLVRVRVESLIGEGLQGFIAD